MTAFNGIDRGQQQTRRPQGTGRGSPRTAQDGTHWTTWVFLGIALYWTAHLVYFDVQMTRLGFMVGETLDRMEKAKTGGQGHR